MGNVTITITGNLTETAPAVLFASGTSTGAYTSSYTNVSIAPSGGPWTVSGVGTAFNSKGLITLDGADNVTIDGGANRNLIFNNGGTTIPAVIWLKSGSGAGLGCINDTIRNCQISSGALNTESYGIIVSGYSATTPVPDSKVAAYDCDNIMIKNNKIFNCFYGVSASGNSVSVSDNFRVEDNYIGSDNLSASIGKYGIYINNIDLATLLNIKFLMLFAPLMLMAFTYTTLNLLKFKTIQLMPLILQLRQQARLLVHLAYIFTTAGVLVHLKHILKIIRFLQLNILALSPSTLTLTEFIRLNRHILK